MENKNITNLERIANEQRTLHLTKNEYNQNKGYGVTHPNAISDGDEKGKGISEDGRNVGSSIDIEGRNFSLTKNQYNQNKSYPDFNV